MIGFLKYLDARAGEASTWATIAALFAALHVNVSGEAWSAITTWGLGAAALLGIFLKESEAGKSSGQIARDIAQELVRMTNTKGEILKTLLFVTVIGSMMVMTSCSAVPSSVQSDGAKVAVILGDLDSDAKLLNASPAIVAGIEAADTAVQTALADLTAGTNTPADFVKLVNDEVNALAPNLMTAFKLNANITTGATLLQQLALLIAADVTPPSVTAAAHPVDPNLRTEIDVWHRSQKH